MPIPAVGMVWDGKVKGFYEMVGRGFCCIPSDSLKAETVLTALEKAIKNPPDANKLIEQKKHVKNSVREMVNALTASGSNI